MTSEEIKKVDEGIKELIMPFAVKSHRAQDLEIRDKK